MPSNQICLFVLTISIQALVLQAELHTYMSSRLVVTFNTASDNTLEGVDLGEAQIVKQYGRRLVLELGRQSSLDTELVLIAAKLSSVQSIDIDHVVSPRQTDTNESIVESNSEIIEMNSNGPYIDGAYISSATQTPLWNLADSEPFSIHVEGVWKVSNSTPDVIVAVIDTGMSEPAKGLFINLLEGYDFISDNTISIDGDGRDSDSTDPGDLGEECPASSWHGTKVAAILAAQHYNGFGMKGVAQNCSVLPIRVLGLCRMGYATDVTDAIVWASGGVINGIPVNPNPAKIISLSLSGQGPCPDYMQSAVNLAVSLGAMVVVAAGNSNHNVSDYFPANCRGVTAVSASTREGKLAEYSNWGELIKLSAPGGDTSNAIMTLSPDRMESGLEVSYGMGTSFAVPHISGLAALVQGMLQEGSWSIPLASVIKRLTDATTEICNDDTCTRGAISNELIERINRTVFSQSTCGSQYISSSQVCGDASTDWCWDCTCPIEYYQNIWYVGTDLVGVWYVKCDPITCPGYLTTDWQSCGTLLTINDCGLPCFCPAGRYALIDLSDPTDYRQMCALCNTTCSVGKYISSPCNSTSNSVCGSCQTCLSGKIRSGCSGSSAGTCINCTAGTYSLAGYTICSSCIAGTYSVTAGASNCTACAAGKYSATVAASISSVCKSCVAPMYCPSGSVTQLPCPAGYYCTNSSIKIACPIGGYCPINSTAATLCPMGSKGNASSASNSSACIACLPGTYSSVLGALSCTACAVGKYANTSNTVNCQLCTLAIPVCAVDQFVQNCSALSDPVCASCNTLFKPLYSSWMGSGSVKYSCTWTCDAGYYKVNNTACQKCKTQTSCASNQYVTSCTNTADGQCLNCSNKPSNSFYTGASQLYDVNECYWNCNDGYNTTSSACNACQTGKYAVNSPSSCTACPLGSFSPETGYSICTLCPAGSYSSESGSSVCNLCPSGSYSQGPGASLCTLCDAGKYSQIMSATACSVCSNTTYTPTAGASVCTQCIICPERGYYATSCNGTSPGTCKTCTNVIL